MAEMGAPLDLTSVLEASRMRQRIQHIGVELEGGWTRVPRGHKVVRDGSVFGDTVPTHKPPLVAVGELTSPPMPVKELDSFLVRCYPQLFDATCGLHIHMSFQNPLSYMRLMDPRYPATIVDYTIRWSQQNLPEDHCIWPRLRNESRYCRHEFSADQQVLQRNKDWNHTRPGNRYTVVNYCYSRTKTVEIRLLPMMPSPTVALSALQMLMNVTNAFLVATAQREKAEVIDVNSNMSDAVSEAIEIYV